MNKEIAKQIDGYHLLVEEKIQIQLRKEAEISSEINKFNFELRKDKGEKMREVNKKYILFDGSAICMDKTSASIYAMADSLKEIREDAKDYGDGVIYSYDEDNGKFLNEEFVEVIK